MPSSSAPCCVPGDIVITQVYSGYLLGRVIAKVGLGPWWTFITVIPEYDEAVEKARILALAEGVRAWLQRHGDDYDPL